MKRRETDPTDLTKKNFSKTYETSVGCSSVSAAGVAPESLCSPSPETKPNYIYSTVDKKLIIKGYQTITSHLS